MTTPAGLLLPAAILVPFAGMMIGLVLGARNAQRVAGATIAAGVAIAVAIARAGWQSGAPLAYLLGDWAPPLGIALRADGLAIAMMLVVAIVVAGIGVYARADFGTPAGAAETRAAALYWPLLLAVWGSLNLCFTSGDLFTLYVALELLTFAGVPLVCLDGKGETLRAALRYLVFALAGSVLYLLGAVLIYGEAGTLDIALVAERLRAAPATWVAVTAMTFGLLAKTALFPMHLWLPPAHAGAPPAASAVLSALVVKGSFFIVVRLWFDAAPALPGPAASQMLAGLGAAAILFGSVIALRQERLKLLIAYSTLAQIGYLFLMFPLAFDATSGAFARGGALEGGMLQALAHACAKAAMFLAAGLLYKAYGHDRIAELGGALRQLPVAVIAFAAGGVALMGILPSGAYLAKKLLAGAADATGQWWWYAVLEAGGFLTTSYVVLFVLHTFRKAPASPAPRAEVPRSQQFAALALAIGSFALAFAAVAGVVSPSLLSSVLDPAELGGTLVTLVVGTLLALTLARKLPEGLPLEAALALPRRAMLAAGGALEGADAFLRRWAVAGCTLLALAVLMGVLMARSA